MQDFRQSSEAISLSQVSKMLRHSLNYKIRHTHLRLFRPDQGPHTVQDMQEIYLHSWRRAYIVVSFRKRNN